MGEAVVRPVHFFLGARLSINIEKRCNHYRLIVACMLSGASRDRAVIVGWSTALRGQVINESLGQLPKKLAAGPRVLARTESSGTQSGTKQGGPPHDHWAKLGQLRYTRSQYSFVEIALFSMKFIAPPSTKKELSALQAQLVGVLCIAALRRVEKPTASPQRSPETEFLGPRKAANSRSVKRPGKTGGKSYRG
jgi:hypothetical protein